MKAEERKALETNTLAKQITKTIEGVKHGPSTSTLMLLGFAVLVIAIFTAWWFYAGAAQRDRSHLWMELASADQVTALQGIVEKNKGTLPARLARFQEARVLMYQGMARLYSPIEREPALKDLERAQELYEGLIRESLDKPLFSQEAMLGVARIQEARGELDKALEGYEKLVRVKERFPHSPHVLEAERRANDLKEAQAKGFYDKLNELAKPKS